MIHYIAPVGSENLIQEHFQVNLKAFSESSDENLCLSLYDSLHDQPDVLGHSKGTRRVQELGDLLKVQGLLLLCPQVLRKSFPSYLKQTEPGQTRALIYLIRHACLDWAEKTFSTFVPKGPVEKLRGHKQSSVGIGQNKSLVCAGFIQKQKPSA